MPGDLKIDDSEFTSCPSKNEEKKIIIVVTEQQVNNLISTSSSFLEGFLRVSFSFVFKKKFPSDYMFDKEVRWQ